MEIDDAGRGDVGRGDVGRGDIFVTGLCGYPKEDWRQSRAVIVSIRK